MGFDFRGRMAAVLEATRLKRRVGRLKAECFEYAQVLDELVAASDRPRAAELLARRQKLQADLRRSVLLQDLHLKLDQLSTGALAE
jgi:hypothetical protein